MRSLRALEPALVEPKVPPDYVSIQWEILGGELEALLFGQPMMAPPMELFIICDDICSLGEEAFLLEAVTRLIQRFSRETIEQLSQSSHSLSESTMRDDSDIEDEEWMTALSTTSERIMTATGMVQKILAPLDRAFVQRSNLDSIRAVILAQLRSDFESQSSFLPQTISSILWALNTYRRQSLNSLELGQIVTKLGKVTRLLGDLEMYDGDVEAAILGSSQSFFEAEGQVRVLQQMSSGPFSLSDYVEYVSHRLNDELINVGGALMPHTASEIGSLMLDALIRRHAQSILIGFQSEDDLPNVSHGFYSLMISVDEDCLKKLFKLFDASQCLDQLKKIWSISIKTEGRALLARHLPTLSSLPSSLAASASGSSHHALSVLGGGRAAEKCLIQDLLRWKAQLTRLLEAFGCREEFETALKDSWESFLNMSSELSNLMACFLAKYCDELLKVSKSSTLSEEALAVELDRVVSVFKFLHSKDFFKAFYRKDLTRRLLLGRSVSENLEKLLIRRLKEECGPSFTAKMEAMFKERELSKVAFRQFRADSIYHEAEKQAGIEFECHVFAASVWPFGTAGALESEKKDAPQLPPPMVTLQQAYTEFYKKIQKGRNLHWVTSIGQCVLKATFTEGDKGCRSYTLVVSQIQALCLLLFNETNRLTVAEVAEMLNVDVPEVYRHLIALVCDPFRKILSKSPPHSKETRPTDVYEVNETFSSRFNRVVVNQILLKETREDIADTEQRVEEDRSHHIDAMIVRLMKTLREMKHDQLISELTKKLVFTTSPTTVKARIESLIEREFLERHPDRPDAYRYLA